MSKTRACLIFGLSLLCAPAALAQCQQQASFVNLALAADGKATTSLNLCVGQVATLATSAPMGTVVVGDPGIVTTNMLTTSRMSLTALRQGETSIMLLAPDALSGATVQLVVEASAQGQTIQLAPLPPAEPGEKRRIVVYRGVDRESFECETECAKQ